MKKKREKRKREERKSRKESFVIDRRFEHKTKHRHSKWIVKSAFRNKFAQKLLTLANWSMHEEMTMTMMLMIMVLGNLVRKEEIKTLYKISSYAQSPFFPNFPSSPDLPFSICLRLSYSILLSTAFSCEVCFINHTHVFARDKKLNITWIWRSSCNIARHDRVWKPCFCRDLFV